MAISDFFTEFFTADKPVIVPEPEVIEVTPRFKGEDIREVWDWRLSLGNPILYCDGDTWVTKVWANDGSGVLAETITDIPTRKDNPQYDYDAVAQCYEWLATVRDSFSREDIEELKPEVAKINLRNKRLSEAYKDDNL